MMKPRYIAAEMSMGLAPELLKLLNFLQAHPSVRARIPAPPDKTVVYSGGLPGPGGPQAAWRLLALAKRGDPQRFDYITLEERLRQFHVVEFGESLFDHANRLSDALQRKGLPDQALIIWRALSGVYIQGARGRVRALVLPGPTIGNSVFSLTEVSVLLRQDVLSQIAIDPDRLRDFRTTVRAGNHPAPLVVM